MKTNTINPLDKPVKLKRLNEKDREMKTKHLDEIGQAPHPGRIARKVRKRRGLTIDDLGVIIGAESSTIELFEKYGDICVWTELPLFQEPEKEKSWGQEVFERYLKAGKMTYEDGKFCESMDWHPVDELPLKGKFKKKLEKARKEPSIRLKSVADIFE